MDWLQTDTCGWDHYLGHADVGLVSSPTNVIHSMTKSAARHEGPCRIGIRAGIFENDGTGLDAVRRSKSRAMELLLFLANYVLEAEPDALEPATGECECGRQHRYYPCAWLIPMWDRRWVPLGDNKQAAATAESIAQLFEEEEERLEELHGRAAGCPQTPQKTTATER